MRVRQPVVAGSFYPAGEDDLRREVLRLMPAARRRKALAAISPHAGYVYSGPVAGEVFSRVEVPERVVLLGPKHTARGAEYALSPDEAWLTPLGRAEVDSAFGRALMDRCSFLREDGAAHLEEHSLEVQLPFLLAIRPRVGIVPLAIGGADRSRLRKIGQALAQEIAGRPEGSLIIASSDLTHYESQAAAEAKDRLVLEAISGLDEELLWATVKEYRVSMCGLLPIYAALVAAKTLGASRVEIARYQTSGEVSGDRRQVVGYAGVVID